MITESYKKAHASHSEWNTQRVKASKRDSRRSLEIGVKRGKENVKKKSNIKFIEY